MTIIVTGAAGFIGSNIVKALNKRGERQIIAVDNLECAEKFHNLIDCEIDDYIDKHEFIERLRRHDFGKVRAVFHEGACSDTMETDGRYMMHNNFTYARAVLEASIMLGAQFLYASSAAIYGSLTSFVEELGSEGPLNIYGYSKFLFDQVVRRIIPNTKSQIVGLRYFNVYGPREKHKQSMASAAFRNFHEFRSHHSIRLFGEYRDYAAGEQTRDFVFVEDVIKVNLFFFDHPDKSGIFNLGTGYAQSFNEMALTVVNTVHELDGKPALPLSKLVQDRIIEYIKFPGSLYGKYQCFTQANLTKLRTAGYEAPFLNVQKGVGRYVRWLNSQL
ncbi:ADP-glyceromanno-heptose 6-epimerase [Candidatus Vallotia tarda]|uniref:ADP-L-glycero-D-manno-heptose-6-epimerase n=1 Tax=Candidatus Vallotiella hemipterorum TaxID=1177213 RepID=A0A916JRS9_9BURK|nr:ADP-glyceromanno-heptose 6-epimerase [Candidatus Vallotia tarda]CAG7598217.1 ADP-L-glycero-D-manno-heptose-6-epimerase [Candidatus Vallotia tarda]